MNEIIITDESNRVFPLSQISNNTIIDTPEKHLLPLIDHSKEDKSIILQEFDGRLMWDNYLSPLYFQKTSSWNTAVTNVLSSRLSILSAGEISPNADYSYILYCPKTDITISPLKYTKEDIFSRSNYYAAIYMYTYGTSFVPCFLFDNLQKLHPEADKKTGNLREYVEYTKSCKQLLGNDFEKCGDKTLSRIFRASLVGKLSNNVDTIKWELVKFGPVLSSIDVYDDFLQFNGLTPYNEAISKKLVGYRSVVIVGWKKINNQEYWIVDPCIGYSWGVGGYFLLKINSGLNIENEAIAIYPDFYKFTDYINQKFPEQIKKLKQTIPDIYYIREQYPINNKYFVHQSYITDEIKTNIQSQGTYINEVFLPDYKTFFAKNISNFLAYKDTSKRGFTIGWFILLTVLIAILLFIAYRKLIKS
jgi:hypothetical protein